MIIGSDNNDTVVTQKPEGVTSGAEGEDQTLTIWCWDPNFNIYAMKEAEKIYQKDHPNFKLVIEENIYNDIETKLITAAMASDYTTLPDIFLMQDYSFHKNVTNFPGAFTELTNSGIDFSQFSAGKLADSTVDGKNYGVPFDNATTIMAIRSDLVEEAGLSVADFKDITWSKFMHWNSEGLPKMQKIRKEKERESQCMDLSLILYLFIYSMRLPDLS